MPASIPITLGGQRLTSTADGQIKVELSSYTLDSQVLTGFEVDFQYTKFTLANSNYRIDSNGKVANK